MKRRDVLKTGGIALTAGMIGLAGCSSSDAETPEQTGGPDASGDTTIDMVTNSGSYYFDPIGLHVESGTTVTFINQEGSHSTVAYKDGVGQATTTRLPDGADSWESSILTESGATVDHTFETAGTYDYFCGPHKALGMVGRIVVGEPGGPADGSMPPDGTVPESQEIVDAGQVSFEEFSG